MEKKHLIILLENYIFLYCTPWMRHQSCTAAALSFPHACTIEYLQFCAQKSDPSKTQTFIFSSKSEQWSFSINSFRLSVSAVNEKFIRQRLKKSHLSAWHTVYLEDLTSESINSRVFIFLPAIYEVIQQFECAHAQLSWANPNCTAMCHKNKD